ncbi:COG4705 family protein [Candidatus Solirubrobacter pratensis]|uniref:hypothetical protein n=1 Tax=Candidatus Solirubrobacter pratensis TaxID=1298857 RepID=UPI0018C92082|nr:hypothetical protein [Candidatus Solirubrobacter pratensis]
MTDPISVLVVTDRIAVSPELLGAIRERAARAPIQVRLLVPNPAPAEWHPTHPERHMKAEAARGVLGKTLPALQEAAGVPVEGFVSTRHDPIDAIEEILHDEQIDELIVATTPHHIEGWLHVDVPHRAAHLGLPVTAIAGTHALEIVDPRARPRIGPTLGRRMLNKVPEVTLYFWVIKIMCTTVGETAADYLNMNLGFGLTNTTYVAGALLIALLAAQLRADRYIPGLYWSVVVVISVFGTLITDNMTDGYNVPLTTSTGLFGVVLAIVFAIWWGVERTLSIHTIFTTRREAFYWLTILFTFALGTAAGDLVAEKLSLGYGVSIAIFGGIIALITVAHFMLELNAVLSFWLVYILTRPLGASIGDFMSQHSKKYGGLGLGTTGTSYIFLGCILALVVYLTVTRRDATELQPEPT